VVLVTASPYYLGRYLGGSEDYPGQYPENVSVTAIAKLGENTYGYWDVAAPEPTTMVGAPAAPFVAFPAYVGEKDDNAAGISCATPIVASLAALVASVYPRLGTEPPGQYADTVKKLLMENADPRAVGFDGFSPECGYGLIDAEKTVKAALRLAGARPVQGTRPEGPRPAPSPRGADVFSEGEAVFYGQVRLAFGLHPERHRMIPAEIDRIERGAEGLRLYERARHPFGAGAGLAALERAVFRLSREKYLGLCRDATASLSPFLREPGRRPLCLL
jgi:hypothetical protein